MEHRRIEVSTSDERGSISDVFYKETINHVALIKTARAGTIRGNHYHRETTQHILMTRGSLRYWYQPADKSEPVKSVVVREGELVTSPPLEIHALEFLESSEMIEFVVFSSGLRGGRDYESDTFREHVILTPDMVTSH